jgi:DNA invertase Pin-like site-specific DNA recombinase
MAQTVATYCRVSTDAQDTTRQFKELKQFVETEYAAEHVEPFHDIVSGTTDGGGEAYQQLRDAISDGRIDVVVVDEISRLSRLGGGEIHDFIQHALEHDTSIRDREVGLSIDVDDSVVDQAVTKMIANLMGDLAQIEHKQKLRRIRSGIASAQDEGKWTGRPPRGFTVENGRLRVDVEEFLWIRAAVERIAAGEPRATVAEEVGVPESTLKTLYNDRAELYLHAETDDDRVDAALADVRQLPEPEATPDDFETRIREIVQDEVK